MDEAGPAQDDVGHGFSWRFAGGGDAHRGRVWLMEG
jgi:hypothetical protein